MSSSASVQIDLDKPRTLKFDLAAIRDLEAGMNGQPLGSIVHQLSQFSVTALTVALWAGLKNEDRTLSPNLVTKMLDTHLQKGGRVRPLMDAVSDAIKASGLFNDEDNEGNDQTATAS